MVPDAFRTAAESGREFPVGTRFFFNCNQITERRRKMAFMGQELRRQPRRRRRGRRRRKRRGRRRRV